METINTKNGNETEKKNIRTDEIVGLIFAITAGLLLLITCCGWLTIFVGLSDLSDRIDNVRSERFAQLGDIKTTIREFDGKLGTLVDKLQRVEQMTLAGGEADRRAAVCGDSARRPASTPPHEENSNDRRK